MTGQSHVTLRAGTAAAVGLALLLLGAGASYVLLRSGGSPAADHTAHGPAEPAPPPAHPAPPSGTAPAGTPLPDIVVPLTPDAAERAGLVIARATPGTLAARLRLPGIVAPNAYRQVAVTPLVSGRITRVSVELGDRVRTGQTLAQIYSPQLAEAQSTYASARAMLGAHDLELQRLQKLVDIGAASRQELERVHGEHVAQVATVQSARSQLELLGMSASAIATLESGRSVDATTDVPAPLDGVVVTRTANVGLNVDASSALFTVVDLSTVWIVADVYEKDFAKVRVGSDATITTTAYPDLSLRGRVSYLDPRVDAQTRTAKARVEVTNPRGELKLDMYVDVAVAESAGTAVAIIPRSAVQHVGDRTVVYLADAKMPDRYTEHEVSLGEVSGDRVAVTAGLRPGDAVVTTGSFFVRAERERLGLRPTPPPASGASSTRAPEAPAPSAAAPAATGAAAAPHAVQRATITVTEGGYEPATVTLRAGAPVQLTFLRTTDKTCGTEVVVPSLDVRRALPLNEPVVIEFTPTRSGEMAFHCGMNMLDGTIVVR